MSDQIIIGIAVFVLSALLAWVWNKPIRKLWRKLRNLDTLENLSEELSGAKSKILNLEKENLNARLDKAKYEANDLKIRNLFPSDTSFDKRFGIWFSQSTGLHYCTSCKSGSVSSPLKEDPQGWHCYTCKKFFDNGKNFNH